MINPAIEKGFAYSTLVFPEGFSKGSGRQNHKEPEKNNIPTYFR